MEECSKRDFGGSRFPCPSNGWMADAELPRGSRRASGRPFRALSAPFLMGFFVTNERASRKPVCQLTRFFPRLIDSTV